MQLLLCSMDKPNFDGPEFQEINMNDDTAGASVPSAMTGRTGPTQNIEGTGAAAELKSVKKKKRKTLAQRLAPKRVLKQTLTGVKGAADKVESIVRGESWTRKHRERRESVDPVKMAAETAYRRRTKDLETLVSRGPSWSCISSGLSMSHNVHQQHSVFMQIAF